MTKIIQVISSFEMGGAEKVAISIAKSNSPCYKYFLVEITKGDSNYTIELKEELKKNGVIYFSSPFKNKKISICLFWTWFIWKYIAIRPDIIHVHTEIPDLALYIFRKISWICFWIHPKYIRTIHNTKLWDKWNWIGKLIERYYKKYKCNIAISSSTQTSYVRTYGGEKPQIIYNGLKKEFQKKFPSLQPNKINILFAGRLEPQKGIDELIAVITALKNNRNLFFHIIGDGSMKDKLYSATSKLNNVNLYPKIYGLSTYLGSFDFIFMPSNYEGLALIPIEASLAHTPTIINSCPGLKDTLPENWELSVKNNCIEDFIKLFSNIQEYNYSYLCDKAYRFALENFSIEKMQQEYEKIYEQKK